MPKWGLACDVACHPTNRVKITARGNEVENELIGDFAGRKQSPQAQNVFLVGANRLGLEQKYGPDDGKMGRQWLSQFLDEIPLIVFIAWPPFNEILFLIQPFSFSLPRPLEAIRRDLKNEVDHFLNFEVVSVLKFHSASCLSETAAAGWPRFSCPTPTP
jgi:hypothetical protein